jgi:hypothetical protein
MFSDERSDYAVPVIGFILLAMATFIVGLEMLSQEYNIFPEGKSAIIIDVITVLLLIMSFVSMKKAYIVDGITQLMFALFCIVMIATDMYGTAISDVVTISIAIIFAILAFMSFRVSDYVLLLINVLGVAMVIVSLDVVGIDFVVPFGILSLIVACLAIYVAVTDWMLVQDIAADYEDEMFDDDDECCCDDDECHCHDDDKTE